jgi:formiminotetrahydrofolate cyclodeaminase
VSDIGAAAALAHGALQAALLTVSANLAYIDEATAATTQAEMIEIRNEAAAITQRVLQASIDAITAKPDRRS